MSGPKLAPINPNPASFPPQKMPKVTLANQALSVSLGGEDVVCRVFGGLTIDKRMSDTASLTGGMELGLGSDHSVDASAKIGFSMKF